ncbi:MAG: Ig-like domain-containing protein [bacterium]
MQTLPRTPVLLALALLQMLGALAGAGCDDDGDGERVAGQDYALEVVSGGDQEGQTGSTLAEPVMVAVRDGNGNLVSGVNVRFDITGGGGSLSAESAVTDANGLASVSWALGSPPVWNRMRAQAGGSAVDVQAWAAPGEPPSLELVAQAPTGMASEDLAFWPGRGLHLGKSGGLLVLSQPGATLQEWTLTGPSISGPVGNAFGPGGELFVCENGGADAGSVKRVSPSGVCEIFSSGFQGVPFGLPNAVAVHGSGDLFLSATCDNRIYRISRQDGTASEFLSVPGPNGLAFDPEQGFLYFTTENGAVFCAGPDLPGGLYRSAVRPDGQAGPIEPLAELSVLAGDGLTFDQEGNLYVVFSGFLDGGLAGLLTSAVYVYTPDGRFHRYFAVALPGDIMTNIEFGAEPFDPYSLYAYGFTGKVYRIRVGIRGLPLT